MCMWLCTDIPVSIGQASRPDVHRTVDGHSITSVA